MAKGYTVKELYEKEQKRINNVIVRKYNKFKETFEKSTGYGILTPWHRIAQKQAWTCEINGYKVLKSYNTIIAIIDKNGTMYDFLDYVFGWTSTSTKHLYDFSKLYQPKKRLNYISLDRVNYSVNSGIGIDYKALKDYIESSINDYDNENFDGLSFAEKCTYTLECFRDTYICPYEWKRNHGNIEKMFNEWVRGLPSACDLGFLYNESALKELSKLVNVENINISEDKAENKLISAIYDTITQASTIDNVWAYMVEEVR